MFSIVSDYFKEISGLNVNYKLSVIYCRLYSVLYSCEGRFIMCKTYGQGPGLTVFLANFDMFCR